MSSTNDHSWSNKPDEFLAEAIRLGDKEDRNLAFTILFERHQSKLLAHLTNKLKGHHDLAEDIALQTWWTVYTYLRTEVVENKFVGILYHSSKWRYSDEMRKIKPEQHIESDIPIKGSVEEIIIEKEQLQLASILPFITYKLSDCERAIWILRYRLEYSIAAISKLMGKKRHTISSALNFAGLKWKKFRNEESDLHVAYQEVDGNMPFPLLPNIDSVVERFDCPLVPDFTSEELARIGMTVKDFHNKYTASLMLQWSMKELPRAGDNIEIILTEKDPDKPPMQQVIRNIAEAVQSKFRLRQEYRHDVILWFDKTAEVNKRIDRMLRLLSKEQLLIVNANGEDFVLSPYFYIDVLPAFWSDRDLEVPQTYISLHSQKPLQRLMVPALVWRYHPQSDVPELRHRIVDDWISPDIP